MNPAEFIALNVADSCSVDNVLSSERMFRAACSAGCHFSITRFVRYECLGKVRKSLSEGAKKLRERLVSARSKGQFREFSIEIADLQEVQLLQNRKRLSLGELSSLAFAKRTSQAFLTDDQGARKLGETYLDGRVQTTPHLLGWLIFTQRLSDSESQSVILEHQDVGRPLARFLEEAYHFALQCRLRIAHGDAHSGSA